MRLVIAAVGRAKPGPHLDLQRFYAERIAWKLSLVEVEERRSLTPSERREREGELLLSKVPNGATVVVLDERGAVLASGAFAQRLAKWRDSGADLAFLIGGADGHGDAVRERADFTLALGPMTWPHLLVRGMLIEQLYRAQQILAGHPYHRE
jgi:23S rRNA (pseudouridine1915-N3)-methyltransferase